MKFPFFLLWKIILFVGLYSLIFSCATKESSPFFSIGGVYIGAEENMAKKLVQERFEKMTSRDFSPYETAEGCGYEIDEEFYESFYIMVEDGIVVGIEFTSEALNKNDVYINVSSLRDARYLIIIWEDTQLIACQTGDRKRYSISKL